MKYGEVLSYKDAEKAKALIGKEVIFCDSLFKINEKPEVCIKNILSNIDVPNEDYIFGSNNGYYYLFIREVIEEKEQQEKVLKWWDIQKPKRYCSMTMR